MTIKLKQPEVIEATYRIVTPMFIGDAKQEAIGISPASVKGALRFWWRALNWGLIREKTATDEDALRQLHNEESKLFGTATDDGNRASFTLRTKYGSLKKTTKNTVHGDFKNYEAARYLGYGVMEAFASRNKNTKAGQLTRECINEDQTFNVQLYFHRQADSTVIDALIAIGLLGGLGSKLRKGMGSVALESIKNNQKEIWHSPATKDIYKKEIIQLFEKNNINQPSLPPFTAFSSKSRVDFLLVRSSPYDVLNDYARAMLFYRSWGRRGKVLGEESEKRFRPDHDWGKKINRPDNFHPRRVIFGLPHSYGKTEDITVTAEKPPEPEKRWHERRASPLFFHVHKVGNEYFGVAMVLPAVFLPQNEKINAGGINVPVKAEWQLLNDFLDGKDNAGKNRFAEKAPILQGGKV